MKNSMKKVSVIIPVYNAEKYIRRCLNSVLEQTWTNLEVICVDDFSTDGSLDICREYEKRDKRIKVISNKKNLGVSATRNIAMELCTGEYISFVDPDDWVSSNMFETIINTMSDENSQIGVCAFYKVWDNKTQLMENDVCINVSPFSKQDAYLYAFKRFSYAGFCAYVWNKVFSRDVIFLKCGNLSFDESLRMGEDVDFFVKAANNSNQISFINLPLYYYYQHLESVSHNFDLSKRKDSLIVYQRLISFFMEKGYDESLIKYAKRFYVYHASLILEDLIKKNDIQNIKLMRKEIKKYLDVYIETSENHSEWNERIYNLINESS